MDFRARAKDNILPTTSRPMNLRSHGLNQNRRLSTIILTLVGLFIATPAGGFFLFIKLPTNSYDGVVDLTEEAFEKKSIKNEKDDKDDINIADNSHLEVYQTFNVPFLQFV